MVLVHTIKYNKEHFIPVMQTTRKLIDSKGRAGPFFDGCTYGKESGGGDGLLASIPPSARQSQTSFNLLEIR